MPSDRDGARGRGLALAAAILPVLLLTLSPGSPGPAVELSMWCVVCGSRGASDAILNVILFVPAGLALAWTGRSVLAAFLIGAALSTGIETAQMFLPHRFPTLGDVIYNASGAGLGALLLTSRARLWPAEPRRAIRNTMLWGLAVLAGLVAQGWLVAPSLPDSEHRVEFTPSPFGMRYGGQVRSLRIDGEVVRPGLLGAGAPLIEALEEGTTVEFELRGGEVPDGIVPLVRIVAADSTESFVVALDHRHILLQYRPRSRDLRLDRPFPRWRFGATRWGVGDDVRLRARAVGGGIVLDTEGGTVEPYNPANGVGPVELGVPTARGWGFLMYPRSIARASGTPLDAVWMFLLALPLGAWGPRRAALAWGAAWIAALFALPVAFPLLDPSLVGAVATALGIVAGTLARAIFANRIGSARSG